MKSLICLLLIFILIPVNANKHFPDPRFTNGSLCTEKSKDFKEMRYIDNVPICRRHVSISTKKRVYAMYGINWSDRTAYTIDHYISLFAGGSNKINNLWPQPRIITTAPFEYRLYRMLVSGRMNIKEVIWFLKDRKDRK